VSQGDVASIRPYSGAKRNTEGFLLTFFTIDLNEMNLTTQMPVKPRQ